MTLTGFSQMKGYKEERRDTKEGREEVREREMCSNKKKERNKPDWQDPLERR